MIFRKKNTNQKKKNFVSYCRRRHRIDLLPKKRKTAKLFLFFFL